MVDTPIYCLGVKAAERTNYNICSYVTAISRKPKLYAIALEHESLTWQLMKKSNQAWLHILRKPHSTSIRPLGQQSGHQRDKFNYLEQTGWLTEWKGLPVLKECGALMLLQKIKAHTYGDHDQFIFEVLNWTSINDQGLLSFKDLQNSGLIL